MCRFYPKESSRGEEETGAFCSWEAEKTRRRQTTGSWMLPEPRRDSRRPAVSWTKADLRRKRLSLSLSGSLIVTLTLCSACLFETHSACTWRGKHWHLPPEERHKGAQRSHWGGCPQRDSFSVIRLTDAAMAFTFAAFCYMLTLVLCAGLIFFVIWQVSAVPHRNPWSTLSPIIPHRQTCTYTTTLHTDCLRLINRMSVESYSGSKLRANGACAGLILNANIVTLGSVERNGTKPDLQI